MNNGNIPDIVDWAESASGFYLPETRAPIKLAPHQRDILRHAFTQNDNGEFPYETVLYSGPKKSGKTTTGGVVATWYGLFVEPPNEIYICANNLEQSIARVFRDMRDSIRMNPILSQRITLYQKQILYDHGTITVALSSDYAGAAGSRHGLTVWDELWGYTTENARRLWDELTPVPTRKNSIRFIVTYAGFEGESKLLEELYQRGMAGEIIPELAHIENGRGEPACRVNGRLFAYWDHQLKKYPGLAISPADYHDQQKQDLRPGAFARLHLNEWTSDIDRFVTREQWAACYDPEVIPLSPNNGLRAYFGADASISRDYTALVGVLLDGSSETHHVVYVKIWKPSSASTHFDKPFVDLSETIGAEILRLHQQRLVASVVYDPYQLHSIATDLLKKGVRMIEFPQTSRRIKSDQALYDGIISRSIRHFNHPILNQHIDNAVAVETPRGFRLAKDKTTSKIDATVALSMAYFESSNQRQSNFMEHMEKIVNRRKCSKDGDIMSKFDLAHRMDLLEEDPRIRHVNNRRVT